VIVHVITAYFSLRGKENFDLYGRTIGPYKWDGHTVQ
jgi:hypothetical protein